MKTKLWRLIIEKLFCKHQWTVHAEYKRIITYKDNNSTKEFQYEILRCTVCGKIKHIKY